MPLGSELDNRAERSYDEDLIRRFLGTTKVATPEEQRIMGRHGVRRCPDCDEWFRNAPRELSLWDLCKRCENERLQDTVAG